MAEATPDNPLEDSCLPPGASRDSSGVPQRFCSPAKPAVVSIALLYAAGNVVMPMLLEQWRSDALGFFFTGALATQVGLLAVAVALTRRPWHESLAVSSLMIIMLCTSFIAGLRGMGPGLPIEVALIVLGVGFASFAVATALLLLVNRYWNATFILDDSVRHPNADSSPRRRLSVGYLMLITAATAVSICLVRWSLPDRSLGAPPQLYSFVVSIVLYTLASLLLLVLCIELAWTRSDHRRYWVLVGLAVAFLACPWINALLIEWLTRQAMRRHLHYAYAYNAGFIFFSLVTLLALRVAGFRFVKGAATRC